MSHPAQVRFICGHCSPNMVRSITCTSPPTRAVRAKAWFLLVSGGMRMRQQQSRDLTDAFLIVWFSTHSGPRHVRNPLDLKNPNGTVPEGKSILPRREARWGCLPLCLIGTYYARVCQSSTMAACGRHEFESHRSRTTMIASCPGGWCVSL